MEYQLLLILGIVLLIVLALIIVYMPTMREYLKKRRIRAEEKREIAEGRAMSNILARAQMENYKQNNPNRNFENYLLSLSTPEIVTRSNTTNRFGRPLTGWRNLWNRAKNV